MHGAVKQYCMGRPGKERPVDCCVLPPVRAALRGFRHKCCTNADVPSARRVKILGSALRGNCTYTHSSKCNRA